MFATVECEVVVFGCRSLWGEAADDLPCVLGLPGVDHVLGGLPPDRWALLAHDDAAQVTARFSAAGLPMPSVVLPGRSSASARASVSAAPTGRDAVPTPPGFSTEHYRDASARLDTDPAVCLAFEDTPGGVAAARAAGLQVVGIAVASPPEDLAEADLVVPSLLSVRVLGTHPFIVMEVDAVPGLGTGAARRR